MTLYFLMYLIKIYEYFFMMQLSEYTINNWGMLTKRRRKYQIRALIHTQVWKKNNINLMNCKRLEYSIKIIKKVEDLL
jgi:hypothetical protein